MSPEDHDFLTQMHLNVVEQSHLFEFPQGSRDLLTIRTVHHGPWAPAECAQILGGWFAKGWLSAFVDETHATMPGGAAWWPRTSASDDPPYRDLDSRDATALLNAPDGWLPGTPDGNVMLCPSDAGDAVPYADWIADGARLLAGMQRSVSRFYRRPWNEGLGDEHDDSGRCVCYFWVLDGVVTQQVERYENGPTLRYDRFHREDEYGFLTVEPLGPPDEWEPFAIDLSTFQHETDSGTSIGPVSHR